MADRDVVLFRLPRVLLALAAIFCIGPMASLPLVAPSLHAAGEPAGEGKEAAVKEEAKAPAPKPPPEPAPIGLSPTGAVLAAHRDASTIVSLDEQARRAYDRNHVEERTGKAFRPLAYDTRYFWFPQPEHLTEYEELLVALKTVFNKLSTQPEFMTPVFVAPNVLRVNVRLLGWEEHQKEVLEKFAGTDVYFHAKKTFTKDTTEKTYDECWPGGTDGGEYYPRKVYSRKVVAGKSISAPSPVLPQKELDDLRHWLYSEVPILNGERFFISVVRQQDLGNKELGTGYYEWFGKKGIKKRQDFFDVIGLREQDSIDRFKEWRAVIPSRTSGVSNNGRQVGALNAVTGKTWFTLDVFDESLFAKGLVKDRLRRGELRHNAEEWYGHLPNRLPITGLFKDDGTVQAKAPPEVGGDKSPYNTGNDPAIHDDLSCMRCHGGENMLKEFKCYIRGLFLLGNKKALTDLFDPDVELELKRQYLSHIEEELEKDQKEYSDAFAELTVSARNPKGLTCAAVTRIYCETWNRLVESTKGIPPVTLPVAARELGVKPEAFVEKLKKRLAFRGQEDLILSTFTLQAPGAMSREEWESRYLFCAGLMLGEAVPEQLEKEKAK